MNDVELFVSLFAWGLLVYTMGFLSAHLYAIKRLKVLQNYWKYWYNRSNYFESKYRELKIQSQQSNKIVTEDSADWWKYR